MKGLLFLFLLLPAFAQGPFAHVDLGVGTATLSGSMGYNPAFRPLGLLKAETKSAGRVSGEFRFWAFSAPKVRTQTGIKIETLVLPNIFLGGTRIRVFAQGGVGHATLFTDWTKTNIHPVVGGKLMFVQRLPPRQSITVSCRYYFMDHVARNHGSIVELAIEAAGRRFFILSNLRYHRFTEIYDLNWYNGGAVMTAVGIRFGGKDEE